MLSPPAYLSYLGILRTHVCNYILEAPRPNYKPTTKPTSVFLYSLISLSERLILMCHCTESRRSMLEEDSSSVKGIFAISSTFKSLRLSQIAHQWLSQNVWTRQSAQTHQNTISSQTRHCGALPFGLGRTSSSTVLTVKLYQDLRFCIDPLSGP